MLKGQHHKSQTRTHTDPSRSWCFSTELHTKVERIKGKRQEQTDTAHSLQKEIARGNQTPCTPNTRMIRPAKSWKETKKPQWCPFGPCFRSFGSVCLQGNEGKSAFKFQAAQAVDRRRDGDTHPGHRDFGYCFSLPSLKEAPWGCRGAWRCVFLM